MTTDDQDAIREAIRATRAARREERIHQENARRAALSPAERGAEDWNRSIIADLIVNEERADAIVGATLDRLPHVDLSTYSDGDDPDRSGRIVRVYRPKHAWDTRGGGHLLLTLPNGALARQSREGLWMLRSWWTGHRDDSGDVAPLARIPLANVQLDMANEHTTIVTGIVPAGQAGDCDWYLGDPRQENANWAADGDQVVFQEDRPVRYTAPRRPAQYQALVGVTLTIMFGTENT